MATLLIPPAVWMLLTAVFLLFGLMCICIGTPGKNILKRSLIWFCASWATNILDLSFIAVYLHNGWDVPIYLELYWALSVQVFLISSTYFFYAAAEQAHGTHLKVTVRFAMLCMLVAPFYEPIYDWDSDFRMGLLGVQMLFAGAGSCWYLLQAYKNSSPQSTRRKRVLIILSLLTFGIFIVFVPVQVFGELLGLLDDPMITAGYVQVIIVGSTFFGYAPIITRYNLVKVELDQIGEGLFRDIASPVLLLTNDNMMISIS